MLARKNTKKEVMFNEETIHKCTGKVKGNYEGMVKHSWASQEATIIVGPIEEGEAIVTGTKRAVIVEEHHTVIEHLLTTCSLAKKRLLE